jgi:hypothetical protein
MFIYVPIKHKQNVIHVKRCEIQTLHCSKRFNFSNAYSALDFIRTRTGLQINLYLEQPMEIQLLAIFFQLRK